MLREIQLLLETHFDGLSRERLSLGYPVYVFEHGLETVEIDSIRRELCNQLARARSLEEEYWLLWIILAAEVGYTYDGDEYWKSFASEFPQWREFGDRDKVRHWFQYFSARYSGFNPSGRWAEHFTIIAWPITHSILPRYLQLQFAKHIYELRYDLAMKGDVGIDQLGELLDERYHGGSSRFENFLQQTALTTRLVLALRDEDVQDAVGPIYRPTLSRIVADMELKGSSRGYLHGARRVLRDARVQAQSGLVGQAERGAQPSNTESIKNVSEGMKLVGRQSSADSWTLGVALPDFTALLKRSGPSEALLEKTRMRFFDKPDGWMPSRALRSYSGRDHPLSKLPIANIEPVIQFEDPSYDVDGLSQKLKILTHSPWLLRFHEDGVAREVLGNHIRTGERYLVATTDPIASDIVIALNLQLKTSRTKEVILYSMDMPKLVGQAFLDALSKLNFGYALRAKVQLIGLVPRWNAALGSSVWLPNEEILLLLSAEFEVTEFLVTLDMHKSARFPVRDRKEIFVSLGMLPLGRHVIEIAATAANNLKSAYPGRAILPETIFIEVRTPIPWQQGILPQAGFRIVLDPMSASFEDLITKRASLSLQGPADRIAAAEVRLFDTNGHSTENYDIGCISLSASEHAFGRLIDKLNQEPLSEKIQSAPRVDLAFAVDELGVASATFPRTILPLRWKLETRGHDHAVRLIDEKGVSKDVSVDRFDIVRPDIRIEIEPDLSFSGIAVSPPGALFVANHNGRRYASVTSVIAGDRLSAFSELGVTITLAAPDDTPKRIRRLLLLQRIWRRSRTLGLFAAFRKAAVLQTLERQVVQLVCGSKWADQARDYHNGNFSLLDSLQRGVGGSPGFAWRMRSTSWNWHLDSRLARGEFFKFAQTYQVSNDTELCELAMRLAFHPASIRLDDPKKETEVLLKLVKNQVLVRGAFFAKLVTERSSLSDSSSESGAS